MYLVVQKDPLGCSVACVAFILGISYGDTLKLFTNGQKKAEIIGFYCKELVQVLNSNGLNYEYRYIKTKLRRKIYESGSIVFVKRSKKYPAGHYLCRTKEGWMDPWINFPSPNRKAGFRKRLSGKPIYLIYSKT